MSKSSKSKSSADKQLEERISQFCNVTGAPVKDARRFLEKYKRVDIAVDAFYSDPNQFAAPGAKRNDSDKKLTALFDKYKDGDGEDITIDGTIKLCEDLDVNPEDVVLLAVAYELKSPNVGKWGKKGWVDGWKALGCDTIESMKTVLGELSQKLGSDPAYFRKVYGYTFDFARAEGQRSLAQETAQAFWSLLLPHGLNGGALSHVLSTEDNEDEDDSMGLNTGDEEGWKEEYVQWWFDFLNEKGGKGVSKDTWLMFLDFVRTIDAKFANYDETAAWPSTIDDFVSWARRRLTSGSSS